jgi:probable phosphoglycerate mutase
VASFIANIDGGARGNPGPAGWGVVMQSPDGATLAELYGAIGSATNNVAEYHGLLSALGWCVEHGAARVHVRSDSLLLVQQMLGNYKVRNEGLKVLHGRARLLAARIGRVSYEHVPREQNKEADRLANLAMDEADQVRGPAPPKPQAPRPHGGGG